MAPVHFLIYSRGRTATQWIAQALSSVPGVMCSHGHDPDPYRPPARDDMKLTDTRLAMHHGVPEVDAYFDMLETKPFRAYGNIHGYDAVKLATWPGNRRKYRCAQITRHPIARILSFAAKWAQPDYGHDAFMTTFDYPHSFPKEDRLIMAAADLVLSSDTGHLLEPVRVFRSEDLTGDPSTFAALVEHVTGLAVDAPDLGRIMRAPPVDKLSSTSLRERFIHLSAGAANYVRRQLRAAPVLREMYAALGYDLDFVRIDSPLSVDEYDLSTRYLPHWIDD